jgi:hypothetical protein
MAQSLPRLRTLGPPGVPGEGATLVGAMGLLLLLLLVVVVVVVVM